MDLSSRLPRLKAQLDSAQCDALLITDLINIRYLTGFTGSAALLFVGPNRSVFITDGRYETQAPKQIGAAQVDVEIEIGRSGALQNQILVSAAENIARLGLESKSVTWSAQRSYAELFADTELVPTSEVVEGLRLFKDAGELARMRAAAGIADQALADLRHLLATGITEREFAHALDRRMVDLGASAPSFDTIVAAGPNGALPHAVPSDRAIAEGDLVVVDFGAVVDGYCSDMTRTFQIGDVGHERKRMWEVVADAQQAGVDAVRSGIAAVEVDAICRQIIAASGWDEAFSHGTGHGVGLLIHEEPRVSSASGDTLAAGHVVTVEPGVYLSELGGVRIEDTVVVTEDGCDPLTLSPKDPVVVG